MSGDTKIRDALGEYVVTLENRVAFLERREAELLAANTREVERRHTAEQDRDRAQASTEMWQTAYYECDSAREALKEELDRIRDGRPDGHRRQSPGLVSSEPVTGD